MTNRHGNRKSKSLSHFLGSIGGPPYHSQEVVFHTYVEREVDPYKPGMYLLEINLVRDSRNFEELRVRHVNDIDERPEVTC